MHIYDIDFTIKLNGGISIRRLCVRLTANLRPRDIDHAGACGGGGSANSSIRASRRPGAWTPRVHVMGLFHDHPTALAFPVASGHVVRFK